MTHPLFQNFFCDPEIVLYSYAISFENAIQLLQKSLCQDDNVELFSLPESVPSSESGRKVVLENYESFQEFICGLVGNDFILHIQDVWFELNGRSSSPNTERLRLIHTAYQKRIRKISYSSFQRCIEIYEHLHLQENILKLQNLIEAFSPYTCSPKIFQANVLNEIQIVNCAWNFLNGWIENAFACFVYFFLVSKYLKSEKGSERSERSENN